MFAEAGVNYIPQQSPKGEREPLLLGHRAAGPAESSGAAVLSPSKHLKMSLGMVAQMVKNLPAMLETQV